MNLAATIRALVAAGATPEMLLAVVETHEDALSKRRASDAARQAVHRQNKSRDTTLPVNGNADTSPHVGEGAQVVTPSLPSLRSEELKPPVSPSGLTAPKGSETARGCRLPEDWRPLADYVASDFGLSHEQHADELAKFLDYWRSVPGAKGRKSDWPATWRNWMRRASENSARKAPHERPFHDAKLTARQANLATLERGADIAARFHREP